MVHIPTNPRKEPASFARARIAPEARAPGAACMACMDPPTRRAIDNERRNSMNVRTITSILSTAAVLAVTAVTGCAVSRGQESVGDYVDDSAITTAVKARFVDNRNVDASAISVETLKGTVMLSGFAKSSQEKSVAESLAWKVAGVRAVKNEIAIRP